MPTLRSSPWIRGAPQSGLARLIFRTNFERDLRSAAARARLPPSEQAKTGPMPADDRLRLDDQQGVQNAGCKPIKSRENEPVELAEQKPLRRFSSQHIDLVARRQALRLERGARPDEPDDEIPD